jgi:hypothetical protein
MGEYGGGRSTWLKRFTDKGEWKPMTLNIALNPNMSMRDNILDGDVMWSSLVQPYLPDVLAYYEKERGEEIFQETRGLTRGKWYFDVKMLDGSIMTIEDQHHFTALRVSSLDMYTATDNFMADGRPCLAFHDRLPDSVPHSLRSRIEGVVFDSIFLTYSTGFWADRLP